MIGDGIAGRLRSLSGIARLVRDQSMKGTDMNDHDMPKNADPVDSTHAEGDPVATPFVIGAMYNLRLVTDALDAAIMDEANKRNALQEAEMHTAQVRHDYAEALRRVETSVRTIKLPKDIPSE